MIKMKPEVKALWTAALKSGEYQQTKGTLRRTVEGDYQLDSTKPPERCLNGFCCLGVLADLYIKANPSAGARWLPDGIFHQDTVDLGEGEYKENYQESGELPRPVMDWAGLGSQAPSIRSLEADGADGSLIVLNDAGMPFDRIAELIEKSL